MLSNLELLALQTQTLFVQNEAKRLLYVNEPERPEAPRFFLGRTKEGVIYRFRDDVPQKIVGQLAEIVAKEPGTLNEKSDYLELYKEILRQHRPVQAVESGPAYRFPDKFQNEYPSLPNVVTITETNADVLDAHFADLRAVLASRQPCVAVIQENRAVSVCCSSRTSPGAAEAGLETIPAFRAQGYAAKVVTGWAAEVRKTGRIPLYSTAWNNLASRAVAKKLGLIMYGTDLHLT